MRAHEGEPLGRVLVLGAGYAGRAVLEAAMARGLAAHAVVRRPEAAAPLRARGIVTHHEPAFGAGIAPLVDATTHLVVTFPPDGETDERVARALAAAAREARASTRSAAPPFVTYLSSTGVYGDRRGGVVDDATEVTPTPSPSAARRLEAEATWRALGATVLRCPAIYGPDRGLHIRVASGKHRIPGDGRGYVSRIHVVDLAALVLASVRAPGETFVVGDEEPAPHVEVVAFVCATRGLPMPPFVPLAEVHESLRGDRRVDGQRALARLGVTLRYPTYRLGMRP